MPSAQLLLRGFERERLRRLVVERLSALHGLGAVGHGLHELGYLLVFLGELGILDGKLVDERGERGGICRIGLFCRISGVAARASQTFDISDTSKGKHRPRAGIRRCDSTPLAAAGDVHRS